MRLHELKCWPRPFAELCLGVKRHEVRSEVDRFFSPGDLLLMREWQPSSGSYTGNLAHFQVAHVSYGGEWGLPKGLCCMTVDRLYPEKPASRVGHDVEAPTVAEREHAISGDLDF